MFKEQNKIDWGSTQEAFLFNKIKFWVFLEKNLKISAYIKYFEYRVIQRILYSAQGYIRILIFRFAKYV